MDELNKKADDLTLADEAVATVSEKSLDDAKAIFEKNRLSSQRKKENIESRLLKNELLGKEEVEATKAIMQANNDRARLSAEEAASIAEYSEEYKKRLQREEERRLKLLKIEREKERLEKEKEKSEQRQEKIEEFLRLEGAASEERELRAFSMLEQLNSICEKNVNSCNSSISSEKPQGENTEKIDTPADITAANEPSEALIETEKVTKNSPLADDELVLKIGSDVAREFSDELTIKIGAHSVISELTSEDINRQIMAAEARHNELCQNAIEIANGEKEKERRLLLAEEDRYRAEITELRERLDELSLKENGGISEMQTFIPIFTPHLPSHENLDSYGDISVKAGEYSRNAEMAEAEFNEAYLESELISDFNRYQEMRSQERGAGRGEYADVLLYPEEEPNARRSSSELYTKGYLDDECVREYTKSYRDEQKYASSPVYPDTYPEQYARQVQEEYALRYSEQPLNPRYYDYTPEKPQQPSSIPAKSQEKNKAELYEHIDLSSYHVEELNIFKRAELIARLDDFYKQEKILQKRIAKIELSQRKVANEENIALIVEKIGLQKEITELSIEALGSAVYADVRSRITRQKRILEDSIAQYNLFCDEYENETGRPLERLSKDMAADVIAGKICKPIPNVYYYGEESDSENRALDARKDREHRLHLEENAILKEYNRYLEDGAKAEYLPDGERTKRKSDRMSRVRYATERDVLLVGLRNEYKLARLEAKRDVLIHTFSSNTKKQKRLEIIEKKIEKIRKSLDRSLKIERNDNARFYLLALLDPLEEKTKRRARRERLTAMRTRLNVLLSEREEINERLIALYGGTDKKLDKVDLDRKVSTVRRKSARAMRKRQQQLARIINKHKAPLSMKEEAYNLLNNKIELVAKAEEIRYKIKRRKVKGAARRELAQALRKTEREIRHNDKEIKFIIKRIKGYEARFEEKKARIKLFLIITVILALAAGFLFVWGDNMIAYVSDFISKFQP